MALSDRDALLASGKMYSSYEIGVVKAAPIVDAKPVVHGRWVESRYFGLLHCSKCHDCYVDAEWISDGKWSYCPNCGADMR